jgi:hypothetical protein
MTGVVFRGASATPHPTLLRRATFSRKGRRTLNQALPTWVAPSAWALRAA